MTNLSTLDTTALRAVQGVTQRVGPLGSLVDWVADRLLPQMTAQADSDCRCPSRTVKRDVCACPASLGRWYRGKIKAKFWAWSLCLEPCSYRLDCSGSRDYC